MKKIFAFVGLSLLVASSSFAASAATQTMSLTASTTGKSVYGDATAATASTPLIGKTSTGVGFGAKTGVGGYCILTQHKSGSRGVGGAHNSTTLVYKEASAPGNPALTVPAASDFSSFTTDTGWTSM